MELLSCIVMTKNIYSAFRELDLQLKLEEVEEKWDRARDAYEAEDATSQNANEVLKLMLEKIKILKELNEINYEA